MALYKVVGNEAIQWRGEAIDGIKHPKNIEYNWTTGELARLGLFAPDPPSPVPPGRIEVDRRVEVVGGRPRWVIETEPEPAPLTDEEKLVNATDLSVEQIKAVLGIV